MKQSLSPNFDARPSGTAVDMLVLHYTGMRTAAEAIARLCDPAAKVSAHYLIEEDGTVVRIVRESERAWHAGVAFWRGVRDVNARSIGIELVNPGHEFGYRAFPKAQMSAAVSLALGVLARHPIPARNVIGHADVAPARKQDPGEFFDWSYLARYGIGLWPAAAATGDTHDAGALLAEFGYDTADEPAAIRAFQRHFRPSRVDGVADAETVGRLRELLRLASA